MFYKLTMIFLAAAISQIGLAQQNLNESEQLIGIARRLVKQPVSREILVADVAQDQDIDSSASSGGEAANPNDKPWIQHGLLVTSDNLDLAIFGQGFFWMINPVSGELRVTRNGILRVDTSGYLVHWEHGDRIMKYATKGYSDIKITDFAKYTDPNTGDKMRISRFEVTRAAEIFAIYENGLRRKVAKLAIVDFIYPRKLRKIGKHVLLPTSESGLPRADKTSEIYSASHEVLDEEAYSRIFSADQN